MTQQPIPQLTVNLSTFSFTIITVNVRGKTTNRCQGQAQFFQENLGNGVTLEMVSIPGGKFLMGSPTTEAGRGYNEGPQDSVTVSPFFLGKYPITQAQWKAIANLPTIQYDLDPDPCHFKGENQPVECVSWYESVEFCARLSEKTGRMYRLPSEAEWEYACRAGTETPFHFGETITTGLANYRGTDYSHSQGGELSGSYGEGPKGISPDETTPVGSFGVANAFSLYDMHGLVWEWCADCWHDNYQGAPKDGSAWDNDELNENENCCRVLRGGSWRNIPVYCRSAYRDNNDAGSRFYNLGFRVVCAVA